MEQHKTELEDFAQSDAMRAFLSPVNTGILAALTVMMIWSGWLVITRWGVATSLTNLDIMLLRFGTASIFAFLVIIWRKPGNMIRIFSAKTMVAGFLCGILYVWPSFIGLEQVPTAHAGVLVNGGLPIFTLALLYFFTRQKGSFFQLIAISLIVSANLIIAIEKGSLGNDYYAYAALLAAAFFLSGYAVSVKLWQITAKDIIIVTPIINLIITAVFWLPSDSRILEVPVKEIVIQAGYQGVLVSVIALWLMNYGLQRISANSFSFIMALVPVTSALLAHLILGEKLTNVILFGGLICSVGIIVFNLDATFHWRLGKKNK